MKPTLSLSVLVILAVTFSAGADEPKLKKKPSPGQPGPMIAQVLQGTAEDFIRRFDRNRDGLISPNELPPGLRKNFDRWDTNQDGKLDKDEINEMLEGLRAHFGIEAKNAKKNPEVEKIVTDWLAKFDTDKDGRISRDEARGPLKGGFDRWDANGDGYLDAGELRLAAKFVLLYQKQNAKDASSGPDFDALDKNADGRLTRAELVGTPYASLFDEIDTNHDGKIDPAEFAAYFKKHPAKGEGKK